MELPHNLEAEQSVLGSVILNQHLHGAEGLQGHFYIEQHQAIYHAMMLLADDGQPIDLITLTARLQDIDKLSNAGGVQYLSQLANSVPSASNQEYYVKIVKEKQLHRQLLLRLQDLQKRAWKAEKPVEVLAEMYAISMELNDKSLLSNDFNTAQDVAFKTYEEIEKRAMSKNNNGCTGIPSGFKDLDAMTSGFQKSDLIIVAARPSVGKTAFSLNIAQHAATKEEKTVAVFSLEMSAQQLMQRMFSSDQSIDATRLRTGYLQEQDNDWTKLTYAVGTMSSSKMFIDDTAFINVYEISRKCRNLKRQHGLDMIGGLA